MIVFLTLIYVVILFVLLKLNVIRLTLFWKLSPVLWMVALMVGLFIPMQFWAPAGSAVVAQYSVPIVPNVSGQVIEVNAEPNVDLNKGDLLFKIDPTPFIASRDQVLAKLELANIRLADAQALVKTNAISKSRVEQYEAQVKQYTAALAGAEYNLAQTEVRAPSDGFVTNLALRPGTRVASFPISQAMAFVESGEKMLGAQISQSYLRYVKPGHAAEVTFKLYPGKVFNATVDYVVKASSAGQISVSGSMAAPREIKPVPFVVRLKLTDETMMKTLPAGAMASVAIYSTTGKSTHIIRKVMIRMDALMNYVNPF